ncbi:hypothetical protein ACFFGT_19035 [Mucilaginibacter angelicae]|uniref:DUF3108 domain-containing protein n=1 Tax=Mucilaginibacter angelicae TaxID=869718 RepID=A0ABV6LA17_9SPHI
MKKIMILLLVLFCKAGIAQNCSQFVNNVNGKKLTYISQDAKGNKQMTAVYVTTKKDATTVAIHAEINDKNGKAIGSGDSEMICTGNTIKVDMKSFVPASNMKGNMQVSGEAKYLTYPTDMKAGQTLDDGSVTIDMGNNGAQMANLQMDIKNRKVEQTETVSTNAGSFDCFKITYDATTKMKMMGIGIPFNFHVTEWYAPKLGRFVKSETYKGEKLMGTMTLDAIN